jgi:hypothetical protein
MDDEPTPEQKFAAENPETMVPRGLMEGRDPEDIIDELLRLDWSLPAARALVARAADDIRRFSESPEARKQLLREAREQFFSGLLLVFAAVLITVSTFLAAIAGGLPFFVIAAGIFCTGLVQIGRGWARWRLYRRTSLLTGPTEEQLPPP